MKTVLGFDFGLKRIGVAVGNTGLRQAQPLVIIDAPTNDGKFATLGKLIAEWQPAVCVVGLATRVAFELPFSLLHGQLDQVVLDAREAGLHLVLLWFGSFKNGMSSLLFTEKSH